MNFAICTDPSCPCLQCPSFSSAGDFLPHLGHCPLCPHPGTCPSRTVFRCPSLLDLIFQHMAQLVSLLQVSDHKATCQLLFSSSSHCPSVSLAVLPPQVQTRSCGPFYISIPFIFCFPLSLGHTSMAKAPSWRSPPSHFLHARTQELNMAGGKHVPRARACL